jgi:hypothetical protein
LQPEFLPHKRPPETVGIPTEVTMKSIILRTVEAIVLVGMYCALATPALAQAVTTTTVSRFPVSPPDPVVLAAFEACVGESVVLSGTIQMVAHETDNASGGMDVSTIFTTQNVIAVGQTTGTEYRAPGEFLVKFNTSGPPPLEYTNIFSLRFFGAGHSFVFKDLFHITINSNGDITTVVSVGSTVCK